MFLSDKKSGFTLIELLVVIAIIGILSTLAVIALGNARTKARDAKRVADLKQISTALELYYSDNGSYPVIITPGQTIKSPDGNTTYMSNIPSNPTPRNDGNCANTDYSYTVDNLVGPTAYNISTCIGSTVGSNNAGVIAYSNTGLFSCGQKISDVDGNQYDTVQIGTQCWMKQNLNTGVKIVGIHPTNNNVIEKACNGDLDASCASDGGLYEWAEAMQYSVIPGVKGICPTGWHVPTDGEQNILDQYLADSGNCDAARSSVWDCSSAGTKLKTGGSSNFNAIFAGYRNADGVTFYPAGYYGDFWSSSPSGGTAWFRSVNSGATVARIAYAQANSYSVRCLKD